jgi:diguanylate cyclase (GGDEF)-like protein/PAS domain S-box-containing protein
MASKQVRILVVEDETIVALDLKNSLKVLGYDVVGTACTGEEAITKADQTRPDLVLMDIILKGNMDGVQAADSIRATLDIPVIFLTACADERTLQRAKVTEAFGYLLKPFEERELHGHIEIALYKHHMERALRESEERYSLATLGANDGLWDWNLESKEIYYSPRWKSMLGYEEAQIGRSTDDWFKKMHPSDRISVEKKLAQHITGLSSHFESEYRIMDADGTYRWMLCRGLALRDSNGKAHRIAGSQTDITDRKVYNPLTGMPNRILLMDRLERSLKRIQRQQKCSFAVVALDVDGLKMINDSLGYVVADQLLIQVSRRVQGCLSSQDTVAHCGNDDFVLLIEDIKDARNATIAAARVLREMEQPFQLDGQTVYVTATAGITLGTRDYTRPEELLRDASTALHRAKAAGKGRCEIFDRDMRAAAVARLRLESDFRKAFEQQEFRVHYQPIVCLNTGRLSGFEALVRWQRPDELVLPGDFIALAESADLIVPLEDFVIRSACAQVAKWQAEQDTADQLTLNVNLSAKHYSQADLVKKVKEILRSTGLSPKNLCLEITESALMENTDTIAETLSGIRGLEVQVHMDDFGTGYSSLSYLHRFPIDTLKIDRSFVGNLGMSEETWKIVQAILHLAQNLGIEVIAEGIENLMQLRMLQSLGCQYGQGYYFSKPLDPREIGSLLARQLPWAVAFDKNAGRVLPFTAEAV